MSPDKNPIAILPSFSRMLRLTRPNREDAIAFIILLGLAVLVFRAAEGAVAPLSALHLEPVTLDPTHLPYYALRTILRMFAALFLISLAGILIHALTSRLTRLLLRNWHETATGA